MAAAVDAGSSSSFLRTWDGSAWNAAGVLQSPGLAAATEALPEGARAGAEALAAALAAATGVVTTDGGPARVLPRVAVLGLSPAGLGFARRLHDHGFSVITYDPRPHAGEVELGGLRGVTRARTARHAVSLVATDGTPARRRRRLATDPGDQPSPTSPLLPPPVLILAVDSEEALRSLLEAVWTGDAKHVPLGAPGSGSPKVHAALGVGLDKRLFPPGTVALCLAPLSPATAASAAVAASKRRVTYVHATLGGATPATCLAGGVWMYLGGPAEAMAPLAPVLSILALGATVLGASPAVACSPALVRQMESLRRSALAMAVASQQQQAREDRPAPRTPLPTTPAPPSVSVAEHTRALAALRAEHRAQMEAQSAAHAAQVASLRGEVDRARQAGAASNAKHEELHATLVEALEASQRAGMDALGQATTAARDRDAERSTREALARDSCTLAASLQTRVHHLEEQLASAERARSGSAAQAAVWEERCVSAEQQMQALTAESDARLAAARTAMLAMEMRQQEERARAAGAANAVETHVTALRASAAGALSDLRKRLAAAQALAATAETAREAAARESQNAQQDAAQLRARVEQLQPQLHAAQAQAEAAEARVAALTSRVGSLQAQLDDVMMDEARRRARAAGAGGRADGARGRLQPPTRQAERRERSLSRDSKPPWSPAGRHHPADGPPDL
jgi:hypothetical protein